MLRHASGLVSLVLGLGLWLVLGPNCGCSRPADSGGDARTKAKPPAATVTEPVKPPAKGPSPLMALPPAPPKPVEPLPPVGALSEVTPSDRIASRPNVMPVAASAEPKAAANPLRGGASAPAGRLPPVTLPNSSPVEPAQPAASAAGSLAKTPATSPSATTIRVVTPSEGPPSSSHRTPGKKKHDKEEEFDAIKVNGPIFVDWPKPKLALVFTGRHDGYLEPCGCAGLKTMKGGVSRHHALFNQLRRDGWNPVGLDVGGLAKGFGRQADMKFQITVAAYKRMGYSAIGLGPNDLRLPAGVLAAETAGGDASPFVCANVAPFALDADIVSTYRVVEAAGLRIGVTAVLGAGFLHQVQNTEIAKEDAKTRLAKIVPELKQKADLLILLAYASNEEAELLSTAFPEFKIIVTAGGGPEPPGDPLQNKGGNAMLVEVGEKGMNAIVVGLYGDPQKPMRYQRVPLDSRFTGTADMKRLMEMYQEQLKQAGWDGLGLKPIPHPLAQQNGRFVGSEKCKDCHEDSYKVWRKSKHAQAYPTLANLDPPRVFDPECISCHVVGWHGTGFFPYQGGFRSIEKTRHLLQVGCESCHGPGEKHCDAEIAADQAAQEKYRKAVVITKEESKKQQCVTCHDGDNSPHFDFDTYWPDIEHRESE